MPGLQTVFNVLIRFEIELWNAVDSRLRADCDLPLSRFAPMQVIARHGSCRVHDIADELSMTVGGTSKQVDRIEASGSRPSGSTARNCTPGWARPEPGQAFAGGPIEDGQRRGDDQSDNRLPQGNQAHDQ